MTLVRVNDLVVLSMAEVNPAKFFRQKFEGLHVGMRAAGIGRKRASGRGVEEVDGVARVIAAIVVKGHDAGAGEGVLNDVRISIGEVHGDFDNVLSGIDWHTFVLSSWRGLILRAEGAAAEVAAESIGGIGYRGDEVGCRWRRPPWRSRRS